MATVLENFIVFEGLDGSGTTTQMQLLAESCDRSGKRCKATFEPTDKPLGRLVRSILKKQIVTTPLPLAMLYAADREDHLHNPIYGLVGELEAGKIVISDRYLYSSLAYQSVECDFKIIAALNDFPSPQYVFYIDTPIEECIKRINLRGDETELFERAEFLSLVRDNYERIFAQLDEGVTLVRLDGMRGKEEIAREVKKVLFSE